MHRYAVDRPHAIHVARLSLKLYEPLMDLGSFPSDSLGRECLETAALLHDIGYFINPKGHHRHSCYIIRHAQETRDWGESTRSCVALLAYFHRKSFNPQKFGEFSKNTTWLTMAAILRIADGLDRGHCQQVEIRQIDVTPNTVELFVRGLQNEPLGHLMQIKAQGFDAIFHRQLLILRE